MRKFLRRLVYGIVGLIAVLVLISALVIVLGLSIDLSGHKGAIEAFATRTLNRPVHLDGKLELAVGLWPLIDVTDVRLGNPAGFAAGDFVRLGRVRLRIGLLPLLRGLLEVRRLQLTGVTVSLAEDRTGRVNWVARTTTSAPAESPGPAPEAPSTATPRGGAGAFVLQSLVLEDIRISYDNPRRTQPFELHVTKGKGATRPDAPTELELSGDWMGQRFTGRIRVGALDDFLLQKRASMRVDAVIARTEFSLEGAVDVSTATPQLDVKASVRGERLDSLRELLRLDLPPIRAYRAAAHLSLQKRHAELASLELRVGGSILNGQGSIDATGARPVAVLELDAPQIELQDFDVGGWSPKPGQPAAPPEKKAARPPAATAAAREPVAKPFSPEVLSEIDARLRLRVSSVLSGKDKLGAGLLEAELRDARISVEPLKLEAPGGTFLLSLSLEPGVKDADARLRLLVKDYDIGVLARYRDPETELGGVVNLDVDLTSTAGSLDDLLAHANGYLDLSAVPENLRSGVIDLWAVNLVAAILTRSDKDASKLNCLVGRWTMRNGVLTPDVLVVDTSKIRICGAGRLDFKRRDIQLVAAPVPKKPQFFNLATPFHVRGKFSDFDFGIRTGELAASALKFLTSPIHVPMRRLLGEGLPQDGGDVCRMPLGPHEGVLAAAPSCGRALKRIRAEQ